MVGEKVKIALVVSAYFIISISMVFMNKFLLNRDDSIPAPFFITWYLLWIVHNSIGISVF